jgi:hypothetical protein
MSSTLTLETSASGNKLKHPFLQELIEQIRLADTFSKYRESSDELLVEKLAIYLEEQKIDSNNLNLDSLYQLLTKAFYRAIAKKIEQKTGHATETYVHVRNREFSSAVIFCGGVLVHNSLISGYKNFRFFSLQELIEMAENYIYEAVVKASYYLDF